ncbi:DUF2835 family protein [Pelobacter seleniigenes]|uniref:DUF2835 family protein n=1 Tax=Pelobacter seleniigenes TaxID=407188 RepID=UPI0004A6CB62|nr:DUF2835 family protein [Pelobacter seleniigenes]
MSNGEKHFYFRLRLSQSQYLRYYQGQTSSIQVTTECGKKLRFPASRLRPFLTKNGIEGRFVLTIGQDNRFVNMQQL